jgi:hypothetical protein
VALWLRSEWTLAKGTDRTLGAVLLLELALDPFGNQVTSDTDHRHMHLRLSQPQTISGKECFRLPPSIPDFYIVFLLYGTIGLTTPVGIYSQVLCTITLVLKLT